MINQIIKDDLVNFLFKMNIHLTVKSLSGIQGGRHKYLFIFSHIEIILFFVTSKRNMQELFENFMSLLVLRV